MTAYCARCRIPLKRYEMAIAPRGALCDFCRDRERHPEAYITHQSLPADCYFGPGALGDEGKPKGIPYWMLNPAVVAAKAMLERHPKTHWHESAEPPYDSAGVARCIHCGVVMARIPLKSATPLATVPPLRWVYPKPCNHGLLKDDLLNGDAFKHRHSTNPDRFRCPECMTFLTMTLQP